MNDIITNEWSIVRISESQFDGENTIIVNNGKLTANDNKATNTKNYVIINNAELSLNLNEFDTPILNKMDIMTPTSIVILDNETKFAAIGQDYEVYAVVCDDNKNIIGINYDKEALALQIAQTVSSQKVNFIIAKSKNLNDLGKEVTIVNSSENRDERSYPKQWT
jgi:hypothetical protein